MRGGDVKFIQNFNTKPLREERTLETYEKMREDNIKWMLLKKYDAIMWTVLKNGSSSSRKMAVHIAHFELTLPTH
jgi:hypothetical protein